MLMRECRLTLRYSIQQGPHIFAVNHKKELLPKLLLPLYVPEARVVGKSVFMLVLLRSGCDPVTDPIRELKVHYSNQQAV